eukprot:m.27272 g.27272  ORF g.27272 m.27272 type:complete len:961 (-) comp4410_c0_seq1:864-3746(-)
MEARAHRQARWPARLCVRRQVRQADGAALLRPLDLSEPRPHARAEKRIIFTARARHGLEGITVAEILELLRDLGRSAAQLIGDGALLAGVEGVEGLAQIPVDNTLDGEVVRAVGEVVAAQQRRVLGAHEHLQVLEEVDVLLVGERDKNAERARHCCVDDDVTAARCQGSLLHGQRSLANVILRKDFTLLGGAVEQALVPRRAVDVRVVVDLIADVGRKAQHRDAAKLVDDCDSAVVEPGDAGAPAGVRVVGKHAQLVQGRLVLDEHDALTQISNGDARADGGQRHDVRRQVLVLTLAQQLPLAHLVQAEEPADARDDAAVQPDDRRADVLDRRLVQELQDGLALVVANELVRVEETHRVCVGLGVEVAHGGDDKMVRNVGRAACQWHQRNGGRNLVGVQGHEVDRLVLARVEDADVGSPAQATVPRLAVFLGRGSAVDVHACGPGLRGGQDGRRHGIVVALDHVDEIRPRVDGHLARRESERRRDLVENGAKAADGDDAKRVAGDRDDALGALLRREHAGEVQRVVGQRRDTHLPLEIVGQPGSARQREHGILALHGQAEQPHAPDAQIARARVREVARDVIDERAQHDAGVDADEDVERGLLLARLAHLLQHERLGPAGQCLRAQQLQAVGGVEGDQADGRVLQADSEEARPLLALGDSADAKAHDLCVHLHALLILVELPHAVQLEVHNLAARQRDRDLPLVDRRVRDGPLAGGLPLVHTAVAADVADALGVHLDERVVADAADGDRRGRGKEAAVSHLLDGLADAEDKGRVDKRHDNVRVARVGNMAAHGPDGGRRAGQLRCRHLRDLQAVPQRPQRRAAAATNGAVELRGLFVDEIGDAEVDDGGEAVELVHNREVQQIARDKVRDLLRDAVVCGLILVVAKLLHLIKVVGAELRRNEEHAVAQQAERVCDGHGVEVLEQQVGDLVLLYDDCQLEDVALLRLQQEERHGLGLVDRG